MKPAKAYFNVLILRLNMYLKRAVLNTYPVIAYVDPSSYCQLRCPGCPTGLKLGLRSAHLLDSELYKRLLDEIGDYLFLIELYNWGEPLLNKKTPEFIRYAKSKDIKVCLHTNMSIKLTDEYIQDLVKSGLDQLIVSADGATQETYEKYRRGGDLLLVRNNMARIKAEKIALGTNTPEIIWKFLVFKHNEHEIASVRTIFKDWGADRLILSKPIMDFNMLEDGFAFSSIPEYSNAVSPSKTAMKAGHKRRLNRCTFLFEALTLNPDGSVSPCCGTVDEDDDFAKYSPTDGFFSAWNSDKFQTARSLFSKSQVLCGRQDKSSNGMVNACQRCRAGYAHSILEQPENSFLKSLDERASYLVQKKDLHHLPDFLLQCILNCSTAIQEMPRLVGSCRTNCKFLNRH